jgi:hypothetical protein
MTASAIEAAIRDRGFAFSAAPVTRALLDPEGLAAWPRFAASWDDLGLDTYMADGGRYRKRRHAAFAVSGTAITRKPHQPHYQSRDYNPLNGGIARWFAPVLPAVADGPAMHAVLRACTVVFDALAATVPPAWHVETHQFRIEARTGEAGQPTPEGMHRDGVDWVLVLLVGRVNIASGVTSICAAAGSAAGGETAGAELGRFTLTEPLDAAWVDDHRVLHGVTPVVPLDPALPAHRDVLVVTFAREK